ncbi:MAG: RES family NAD+ phosphorylase [Chloroflexota bacterium]|nr:RES family NAD+ phosphorylase [Chloroflexota bacterium]
MTSHQHPAAGSLIYRIGRAPEPRAWPPANIEGRYSHPEGAVRVLYGASERRAAFLETLQSFRPALADLAALKKRMDLPPDFPGSASPDLIPADYFRRRLAMFRVPTTEPMLDLCSPATHALLRRELAAALLSGGYSGAFNFGEVIGSDYRLTQLIARWAHDHEYTGVAYPSAHDHSLTCWAVFDTASIILLGEPEPIPRDDPDLHLAAILFGLRL